VINVVTRTAASLDGAVVGARIGSAGHRQVSLAAGRALGPGVEISGSALVGQSEGDALYFREYDDPETNDGFTFGVDGDRTASALAAVRWGDLALRSGYLNRSKGVATGAYEIAFNDPRSSRYDRFYWAELSVAKQYRDRLQISGRVYYDWYDYHGTFPGSEDPPYTDGGGSASVGAELLGVWDFSSRLRMTLGGEYRDVLRASYEEVFSDGTVSGDDAPFQLWSAFGQAEYHVSSRLTTVVGVRTEEHSRTGNATAPRVALILSPSKATTLKLLYGHAYRAPSAAEAHLETSFYERNPALRPERIRTLELAMSHRFTDRVLAGMSIYDYRLRNLIDQVEFTEDGGLRFQNTSHSQGTGVEFEIATQPLNRLQVGGSYTYQAATTDPDGMRLTNAPEHIATIEATVSELAGIRPTVAMRHESGRRTVAGTSTEPFLRTDLHLALARGWGFNAGLRVTNLFDVSYAVPVGIEHRQHSIAQPGRRFSLYGSWRF
jgi:iron complex outermembrane receptor protein